MKKAKRKTSLLKRLQKGSIGGFFAFGIVALLLGVALFTVGGIQPSRMSQNGDEVKIITPTPDIERSNLQLQTFGYITIAPTPNAYGNLCKDGGVNNEPEILVGYSPAAGQSVGATGQIKVWVNDEGAPFVAPNEQVDATTGKVISHGDTTAKAADNFLYEPALYLDGQTAESDGSPYFPDYIKGQYNNNPPNFQRSGQQCNNGITGAPIDTPPSGSHIVSGYCTAEYIWNISSLGLSAGSHQAEFVIHDGDRDRGVGCINITIQ